MKTNKPIIIDNLPLAPVSTTADKRNSLPKDLFKLKPQLFMKKLFICYGVVFISYALIMLNNAMTIPLAIVILGFMYAHMVELQHECLHEGVFKNRHMNRLFGFMLGIFMMSSYSHYKFDHMVHHAYLGTPNNREFFNYKFRDLNSIYGLFKGAFNFGRYIDVFKNIYYSFTFKEIPRISGKKWMKMIKNEYRIIFLLFIITLVFTMVTRNMFFVYAWYLPAILISEATHFLIELPEHYGLNTVSNPDAISNTRTIRTNPFFEWFTNYNNLHTAHHYQHRIPICNIRELHQQIYRSVKVKEESYWSFYKKIISGEITYNQYENIMTR